MLTRLHNRAGHYLLLVALSLVLFFPNLGGPSLWDIDEGKNSACTIEMRDANNWVIPTFNGLLRPDKPALLYWLQMAAYHYFGVNEFAGRLPSALAALATVLLAYELARAMFTPSTGLLAGIVAAATPMLCGAARFANPDALLNLFIVLTLALFWIGWQRPRLWWFLALGAAEGGGMLAKGAVGVVLPVGIIALFLLWQRRLWLLFDRRNLAGGAVFLLVAAPWYVRVTVETKGAFARDFFLRQHVERFLNHAHPMENHGGGIWYYPLVVILGTVPWAVFLGPALWYAAWSALREPGVRLAQLVDGRCRQRRCTRGTGRRRSPRGRLSPPRLLDWPVPRLLFDVGDQAAELRPAGHRADSDRSRALPRSLAAGRIAPCRVGIAGEPDVPGADRHRPERRLADRRRRRCPWT